MPMYELHERPELPEPTGEIGWDLTGAGDRELVAA